MTGQRSSPFNVYVCRYCGQPDPGEWGVDRRCPEHPGKDERAR